MPILVMLVAAGALYLLQAVFYNAFWSKGLKGSLNLGKDRFIFEEETVEAEETLINDKFLPLPWVYYKFTFMRNGKPSVYHSDMFSIANRRMIRRKRKFTLNDRGVYTVDSLNLVSHDLFLSRTYAMDYSFPMQIVTVYPRILPQDEWPVSFKELMGEGISRRFFPEDPYLFKGIRDYQSGDSLRSVNFAASAKSGEWKVNIHETIVARKVKLLLGMDKAARYYDPVLYEQALRIAASLAQAFEKEGIPVALWSNGTDALSGNTLSVEAGCGEDHIYTVLEALARMDTEKEVSPSLAELEECADNAEDTQFIFICPAYRGGLPEAYKALAEAHPDSHWFLPCTLAQAVDRYFEPKDFGEELPGFSLWPI